MLTFWGGGGVCAIFYEATNMNFDLMNVNHLYIGMMLGIFQSWMILNESKKQKTLIYITHLKRLN